jgi:hypothetical protein
MCYCTCFYVEANNLLLWFILCIFGIFSYSSNFCEFLMYLFVIPYFSFIQKCCSCCYSLTHSFLQNWFDNSVTRRCKICRTDIKDMSHALYKCPHARNLYMRQCDHPEFLHLIVIFRYIQNYGFNLSFCILAGMIVNTLLVAWRA